MDFLYEANIERILVPQRNNFDTFWGSILCLCQVLTVRMRVFFLLFVSVLSVYFLLSSSDLYLEGAHVCSSVLLVEFSHTVVLLSSYSPLPVYEEARIGLLSGTHWLAQWQIDEDRVAGGWLGVVNVPCADN